MPILRLPKTIRWILVCAVLFLVPMSLYRLGIHLFFDFLHVNPEEVTKAFWTGVRFDARVVGLITLLLLLLSFWPGFHFFKTAIGKNTALLIYGLFILSLLAFYAADLVSLFVYKTRLSGTLVSELAKNTEKGKEFSHGAPWMAILLFAGVVAWLFFMLIKKIHSSINKKGPGSDQKLVRIYWQVLVLVLCVVGIYGRIGKTALNTALTASQLSAAGTQLALSPFESFFSTLPKRSK